MCPYVWSRKQGRNYWCTQDIKRMRVSMAAEAKAANALASESAGLANKLAKLNKENAALEKISYEMKQKLAVRATQFGFIAPLYLAQCRTACRSYRGGHVADPRPNGGGLLTPAATLRAHLLRASPPPRNLPWRPRSRRLVERLPPARRARAS